MEIPSVVYSALEASIQAACKSSTDGDTIFKIRLSNANYGGYGDVILDIHGMYDLSSEDAVIYREDLDNVIRLANCIHSLQLTPVYQGLTDDEFWPRYCSLTEELTGLVKSRDYRQLKRYIQSFALD